jgi:hypothetical protein
MTEEIIIDGVNVAGCIYYKQECIANCGMFALGDFKCEGQICLYKQLKRLEQENERLKNRNVELQITLNEFDRFNNYRSALEKIKDIINQPCDNCKYNKDGVTCSIGDCGEGKLKIIENKINEVLGC